MPKLSKKDEKIIQHFAKIAQQNTESVNHISTCLQPLIGDIKRMCEFNLNFLYIIIGDPFFDFEVIGNILRSKSQSIPMVELEINSNLLVKNSIEEYFNMLAKQINESNLKMDELPKYSDYQGSPFFVINRYTPEPSMSRLQSKNSDINQLANIFDEIARLILSPHFKNFGIVLLLPEQLEERCYKTFQQWDAFKMIKMVTENKYRTEVCKKLIENFSERERVPYLKNLENTELISIINQAFDITGFNPRKFLNKLKEKVRTTLPKPVTKGDLKFFKDAISVLSSTDKTRHAKLRSLLRELMETNFDARNILIELINGQIQEIEKAFDSELKERCKAKSLNLTGEYPNYSIDIEKFGIQIKIEVRSPYGNVYVDGVPLENKFPSGVVERIKERNDTLKKLRPKSLTENELINLFVGYLTMYKGTVQEIIDINEFLDGVLIFLNSNGIYPISVDKKDRGREYLKKEFAKAPVIEALKRYVTFETGKITEDRGIQLPGLGDKLYTIMKIQRSDSDGNM